MAAHCSRPCDSISTIRRSSICRSRLLQPIYGNLKSITTEKITGSLKRKFLTHGIPVSLKTDNGPQFRSCKFQKFAEGERIDHRLTEKWRDKTALYLRGSKLHKLRRMEKKIDSFLIMYRTTLDSTTGVSPAELLFRRKLRTRIPGIDELHETDIVKSQEKGKVVCR